MDNGELIMENARGLKMASEAFGGFSHLITHVGDDLYFALICGETTAYFRGIKEKGSRNA